MKEFENEALPVFRKHFSLVAIWKMKCGGSWEVVAQLVGHMQVLSSVQSRYGLHIEQLEASADIEDPSGYETPGFLRALNKTLFSAGLEDSDNDRRFKKWCLTYCGRGDEDEEHDVEGSGNLFGYDHREEVKGSWLNSALGFYGNGKEEEPEPLKVELDGKVHELSWAGLDWAPTELGEYALWSEHSSGTTAPSLSLMRSRDISFHQK